MSRAEAIRSIVAEAKAHYADAVIMLRLTEEERRAGARMAKGLAIAWRMDGPPRKKPRSDFARDQ
jgi:uncharacterized protein YbjQ (UPF0145 family)